MNHKALNGCPGLSDRTIKNYILIYKSSFPNAPAAQGARIVWKFMNSLQKQQSTK